MESEHHWLSPNIVDKDTIARPHTLKKELHEEGDNIKPLINKTFNEKFRRYSLIWDDPVILDENDNGEVADILEEAPINIGALLSNSDGHLFSLPVDSSELSAESLVKRRKPGRKANFTPEEDNQLAELVKKHGETKWSFIATIMTKWNRKQLRERYINFIKGSSTAANFTPSEDAIVLDHIKTYGHTWKDLALKLPGRSPIAIKNRYYKVFLKRHPSLCVSYKDMKGDIVSDIVSTKCNSVNEKIWEERVTLEDKLQMLIQQEERFIEGIKKINEKLHSLENIC